MQTVSWAGSTYNIPNQRGDTPWSGLSDFAIAVAAKGINTGGGNFTLLSDLNLGASFGLVSAYFKSRSANIASAGIFRLANTDTIKWRNAANSADNTLSLSADSLQYNGATLIPAGAGSIVNADISASAAIAFSKMAALTVSRALVSSAGGVVTVATTTATEIGYVNGVTSAIQTQLDSKPTAAAGANNRLAYYTGTAAIAAVTAITASRALASDANGLPVAATTTATELGYVNGVTSAIQTQIDGKRATFANGQLPGTATNDSASAGNVGQYVESVVSSGNIGTSAQYADATSISLTAGDWDVTGCLLFTRNGSSLTGVECGISTASGNSGTGLVGGSSVVYWYTTAAGTTQNYVTLCVPSLRMSLSGTTTVYLKMYGEYTVATPQRAGRISARRVR